MSNTKGINSIWKLLDTSSYFLTQKDCVFYDAMSTAEIRQHQMRSARMIMVYGPGGM
jgi:hypothetical protein